jgi:hypothetical protein
MPHFDAIFSRAKKLLSAKGIAEAITPIDVAVTFEDQKIAVRAYLNKSHEKIEMMVIHVNIPSGTNSEVMVETPGFGLPSKKRDWSLVYQWREVAIYQRQGKWIGYLDQLCKEIDTKQAELGKMNGKPINDRELFEDIPD